MKKTLKVGLLPMLLLMMSLITSGCTNKTVNTSVESSKSVETEPPEEKLKFTICTGELGEYGACVTLNKGKTDEIKRIYYHVPAGTYKVSNDNKYMQQLNIYSDETRITEEGFEEPAEIFGVELLEPFESVTITIKDGQAIYFSEGKTAFFTFKEQ